MSDPASTTARYTILLVDDEPHVRFVMSLKLRDVGYHVEMASDGEEGLRAAHELSPSLIVSDYQMPRVNGLQMCKRLGADPATNKIPIILLTSRDFEITEKETAGTSIRFVRNKPFSPREILGLIQQILPKKAA